MKTQKLSWCEQYQRKLARKREALENKRLRILSTGQKPVYIIEPHEHGNGGWCGQTIHGVFSLRRALKINPIEKFCDGYYEPFFGSQIGICGKPDINTALFVYDENQGWTKGQSGVRY